MCVCNIAYCTTVAVDTRREVIGSHSSLSSIVICAAWLSLWDVAISVRPVYPCVVFICGQQLTVKKLQDLGKSL